MKFDLTRSDPRLDLTVSVMLQEHVSEKVLRSIIIIIIL